MTRDSRALLTAAQWPREFVEPVLADADVAARMDALIQTIVEPPSQPFMGARSGRKHIKVRKLAWETIVAVALTALAIGDPTKVTALAAGAQLLRYLNVLSGLISSLSASELEVYDAVAIVSKKLRDAIGSQDHYGATEGEIAAYLKKHGSKVSSEVLKGALLTMSGKNVLKATPSDDKTYYRPVF